MIPLRARRLLAALLAGAGLAALVVGALRPDLPLADSARMVARFWRAGPRGRLLNAPGLARDAAFADEARRAAAAWPRGVDAELTVGALVPSDARERLRRVAAYVLAPRRVRLATGAGADVRLAPVRPGRNAP